MRFLILLSALSVMANSAFAQPGRVSAPVVVTNAPSDPVPVVGTVKLDGSAAITGATTSADETATVFDASIEVTTPLFANHFTPVLDVSGYKEVRVMVNHGSCSPCGEIVASVSVRTATGRSYQLDVFPVNLAGAGAGSFNTRTYTVPGPGMVIALRATAAGTNNSVGVGVFGRAN